MFKRKRGFRAERRVSGPLTAEILEMRTLLATTAGQISLTNVATGNTGNSAFGVAEAGALPSGGAGWTVANVGDTTGDGFDDFLIGAPTVTGSGTGLSQGSGNNSRAYLIFGSQTVNSATIPTIINWLTIQANQRVGDLGTLGNAGTQVNPTNPTAVSSTALQFNGVTFFTSQNPNSQLGASVTALGDLNGDGFSDFMIGAPGSTNAAGANPGTGRAYIIYGGPTLANSISKSVDLDTPSSSLTPVISLVAQAPGATTANGLTSGLNGAHIGQSVAGAGDFIADGFRDVAIGAPNASPPATTVAPNSNAGEVFVISGTFLRNEPATSETLAIDNVGQAVNNIPGVVFVGAASGDEAGFSVAGAGNVSKSTTFNNQSDLLIGAPGNSGQAYLVNAQLNFSTFLTTANNVTSMNLGLVGANTSGTLNTGAIPVTAQFVDGAASTNASLQLGYSVASAGNFVTTSFNIGGAIMLGDPGAATVYLLNGIPTGIIDLNVYFANPAFPISTTTPGGIIQNGSVGGTSPFIVDLDDTTDTNSLLGFSESAVGSHTGSTSINDIALGAPGTNGGQGAVYLISSPASTSLNSFLTVSGSIINVNGAVGVSGAGGINGLQIIAPPNDQGNASNSTVPPLVTTTPAFLGASVSGILRITGQTGFTTDQDVIGDVIVGVPGYSLANYPLTTPPATTRTQAGAVFAIEGGLISSLFTGGNTSGGGGGGGGGGGQVGTVFGTSTFTGPPPANLPLGSSLIPPIAALSTYDSYQPIPQSIAYAQFEPSAGWLLRMEVFSGKVSAKNPNIQRHLKTLPGHNNSGVSTLNAHVFSRDKYHPAKVLKVHHAVAVIPKSRQRNVYFK